MRWSRTIKPLNPFEELATIEHLLYSAAEVGTVKTEAKVPFRGNLYPIYSASFGPEDKNAPCFLIVGGVHGLEKIGTHVTTALLSYTLELLRWDESLQETLNKIRLVFIPLLNPVGMHLGTRSNGSGVDLMRNAPIEATSSSKIPFVSGQTISKSLPWFRGDGALEVESQALEAVIQREVFGRPLTISLDIHSGFGAVDRIWFPYACKQEPVENLAEVFQLKKLLDRNLPNHIYQFEPQCLNYTAHGDLWDYFYLEHLKNHQLNAFLPLCLEIGSWIWIKKNPKQLLSLLGMFNPILPHRMARALRRHIPLFEFLLRLVRSYDNWLFTSEEKQLSLTREAKALWFEGRAG